jgi:hypothetical protein
MRRRVLLGKFALFLRPALSPVPSNVYLAERAGARFRSSATRQCRSAFAPPRLPNPIYFVAHFQYRFAE